MTTTTESLTEQVSAANRKEFKRPPVPAVFEAYSQFMATGAYPYTAEVLSWILARHPMPAELHRTLEHEVYLASGTYRVQEMDADYTAALAEGWLPITDLDPVPGMRIVLRGDDHPWLRVSRSGSGWALMPPRARTNGYRLDGYQDRHTNFMLARQEQYLSMNNPRVVMYRIAT